MNKFWIFFAALLLTFNLSKAQTSKGTQNIGADIGFSATQSNSLIIDTYDNSSYTLNTQVKGFNFGPAYGYFIGNNLLLGGGLTYSTNTTTNATPDIATTNNTYPTNESLKEIDGVIYLRKYYMYKNKVGLRVGPYLGYGHQNQVFKNSPAYTYSNLNSITDYYWGGLDADLVYFPSKSWGIVAGLANLQYEHYNQNNTTQGHTNSDGLYFNFVNDGLSLSIFYVFGSKG